jgi:hypothetical protein
MKKGYKSFLSKEVKSILFVQYAGHIAQVYPVKSGTMSEAHLIEERVENIKGM